MRLLTTRLYLNRLDDYSQNGGQYLCYVVWKYLTKRKEEFRDKTMYVLIIDYFL